MKYFQSIRDTLVAMPKLFVKMDGFPQIANELGYNYPFLDTEATLDSVTGENNKDIWIELNKYSKRLAPKLKDEIEAEETKFVMHHNFRVNGVAGKEAQRYMPFTLSFDDGQVLTALVRNSTDSKQYNAKKPMLVAKWALNAQDITREVYKNGDTDIDLATTVTRLSKIINFIHTRFVKDNPLDNEAISLAKEIDEMSIDLSGVVGVEAESSFEKSKRLFVEYAMDKLPTLSKEAAESKFDEFWDETKGQSMEDFVNFIGKDNKQTTQTEEPTKDKDLDLEDTPQKINVSDKLKEIRHFISKEQYSYLNKGIKDVEIASKDIIDRLHKTITEMPKVYGQDGKGNKAVVYLHYFNNNSDWYITEKDTSVEQHQAFGYAIINGDKQNAELGYISIEELTRLNVELDFYYTSQTLGEVKGVKEVEITRENISEHYPTMSTEDKNKYQDIIDSIIQGRAEYIAGVLGLDAKEWNLHAEYEKSKHDTNVITQTVFGVVDKLQLPIEAYISEIKKSEAYKAYDIENLKAYKERYEEELQREKQGKTINDLTSHETYKKILKESMGGIMYNVADKGKYDVSELLKIWNSFDAGMKSSAGGIVKGLIDFIADGYESEEKSNNSNSLTEAQKALDGLLDPANAGDDDLHIELAETLEAIYLKDKDNKEIAEMYQKASDRIDELAGV